MDHLGFIGFVAGWSESPVDDTISATPDGGGLEDTRTIEVDGLARWVASREIKLGWGRFLDGAEVPYVYDAGDDCFGYAVNVSAPQCSEWGYAPFRQAT